MALSIPSIAYAREESMINTEYTKEHFTNNGKQNVFLSMTNGSSNVCLLNRGYNNNNNNNNSIMQRQIERDAMKKSTDMIRRLIVVNSPINPDSLVVVAYRLLKIVVWFICWIALYYRVCRLYRLR